MIGRIVLVASVLVASCWLSGGRATAQDVPGIEICTVEKTMERRTSCLQSNVDFLQKTISKLAADHQQKLDAANRQIEALKGSRRLPAEDRRRPAGRAEEGGRGAEEDRATAGQGCTGGEGGGEVRDSGFSVMAGRGYFRAAAEGRQRGSNSRSGKRSAPRRQREQ